ncbi:MAG: shikimate kinase [Candidatus Latescibacterota bacterium]|jgi:shikimate kinase
MKIVLVGYRAAGKSTLGKKISAQLAMPYLDIDRGIEQRIGEQTLTAFYGEVGEEGFRPLETEVVVEMCQAERAVIAFGAGSLMRPANQEAAQNNALVVYLQVSVAELWRRIQGDPTSGHTRPNLAGGGIAEVEDMLALREPIYLVCADLLLDGALSTDDLIERVVSAYKERGGL